MATQDKVMLMTQVEDTLKTRMFANLLEEAVTEIQGHLDGYDIQRTAHGDGSGSDDLLTAFISTKRVEGRSENTLMQYHRAIQKFFEHIGGINARDVTTYHVRDYLAHEQARGLSDTTVESNRQILNGFFGWLAVEKLIPRNPMTNVGAIKCKKVVKEAYTDADLERLKRACKGLRDTALLNVLRSTGCRVSEVSGLNIDDVNFDRRECLVTGKGNKQRIVYLDAVAVLTLREYIASRSDDLPYLFVGQRRERLTPFGIRTALKKIAERAGVDTNVHPHKFRRTLITNLLNWGMPLQEVAILAGHGKVETTMKYFAASNNRIRASYERYSR